MSDETTEHSLSNQNVTEMEKSLLDSAPDDARLNSGVKPLPGNGDLTFINMSGLVEPVEEEAEELETPEMQYNDSEMDPNVPVSFFEKGIDDVDAGMDPISGSDIEDSTEEPSTPEATVSALSESLSELEGIIAELNEPYTPEDTEDALAPEKSSGEDIMAKNLEAASASLDALSENIDTEAAEALADEIPMLDSESTPPSGPVAVAPSTHDRTIGVNLEEAEFLLNELESQEREEPQKNSVETLVESINPVPPAVHTPDASDMDFEELLHNIAPDMDVSDHSVNPKDASDELVVPPGGSIILRMVVIILLIASVLIGGWYGYIMISSSQSPASPAQGIPASEQIENVEKKIDLEIADQQVESESELEPENASPISPTIITPAAVSPSDEPAVKPSAIPIQVITLPAPVQPAPQEAEKQETSEPQAAPTPSGDRDSLRIPEDL